LLSNIILDQKTILYTFLVVNCRRLKNLEYNSILEVKYYILQT